MKTVAHILSVSLLLCLTGCEQAITDPQTYVVECQRLREQARSTAEQEGRTLTATYHSPGFILAREVLQGELTTQRALDTRQAELEAGCHFLLELSGRPSARSSVPEGPSSTAQVHLVLSSGEAIEASLLQEETRNTTDRFYHAVFPIKLPEEDFDITIALPGGSLSVPFNANDLQLFPTSKFQVP